MIAKAVSHSACRPGSPLHHGASSRRPCESVFVAGRRQVECLEPGQRPDDYTFSIHLLFFLCGVELDKAMLRKWPNLRMPAPHARDCARIAHAGTRCGVQLPCEVKALNEHAPEWISGGLQRSDPSGDKAKLQSERQELLKKAKHKTEETACVVPSLKPAVCTFALSRCADRSMGPAVSTLGCIGGVLRCSFMAPCHPCRLAALSVAPAC